MTINWFLFTAISFNAIFVAFYVHSRVPEISILFLVLSMTIPYLFGSVLGFVQGFKAGKNKNPY